VGSGVDVLVAGSGGAVADGRPDVGPGLEVDVAGGALSSEHASKSGGRQKSRNLIRRLIESAYNDCTAAG
jgi:hypothetical protein